MTDYRDLITPYHRGQPKFSEMVRILTEAVQVVTDRMRLFPKDFDIDIAIGAQLDVDGEWVGRSRAVLVPVARNWFTLDTVSKGFDQGEWFRVIPADLNVTLLDDETYRTLLKAKILANGWDGTAESAREVMQSLLPPGTRVFVEDTSQMRMTFCIAGLIPSALLLILFSRGYLPLKPAGVQTDYLVTSVNDMPLFGFDVQNSHISGFDMGALGVAPETLFT